jgi:RimJ/RimL family protein N-acetyltransferase
VAQALRATPEQIKSWVPEDRLQERLADSISGTLKLVEDEQWVENAWKEIGFPNTKPEDYRHRIVSIGDERTFLAGMRFRDGKPDRRFVEVCAQDFPLDGAQTISEMAEAARRAFEAFSPERIRIHVPFEQDERTFSGLRVAPDFVTVAAPVSHLQSFDPPPHIECVRLSVPGSTEFYDRYLAAYQDFHEEYPELAGSDFTQPFEDVKSLIAAGSFYEVFVDDKWAGVIGTEEATAYGMSGYQVTEKCLTKEFRGRGLAPAMERRLIDRLPKADGAIFHGSIDSRNVPSLATAKRVGRVEVMIAMFVDSGKADSSPRP